jgi:hypothetical protein
MINCPHRIYSLLLLKLLDESNAASAVTMTPALLL